MLNPGGFQELGGAAEGRCHVRVVAILVNGGAEVHVAHTVATTDGHGFGAHGGARNVRRKTQSDFRASRQG